MKRIIKSAAVGIVLLLVSHAASAAGEWSGIDTIDNVYITAADVYVRLDQAASHLNSNGCVNATYYKMDRSLESFKEQYQLLLAAKASGNQVRLWSYECSGNYPLIRLVRIY